MTKLRSSADFPSWKLKGLPRREQEESFAQLAAEEMSNMERKMETKSPSSLASSVDSGPRQGFLTFTQCLILLGFLVIIALIVCAVFIRRENSQEQMETQRPLLERETPKASEEEKEKKMECEKILTKENLEDLELQAELGDVDAQRRLTQLRK